MIRSMKSSKVRIIMRLFFLIFLFSFSALSSMVNGLYVKTFGNSKNQSIVFLHGGPGYNSFNFENSTAQNLADLGYFVVVYDQRGSSRSESATLENFNFKNSIQDLNSIIDSLKISRPILVGHSFGGTLAIKFAQIFSEKIKSIVLVSAPIDQREMVKSILDNCEKNYLALKKQDELQYLLSIKSFIFADGKYQINTEYGQYLFAHAIGCGLYNPDKINDQQQNLWKKLLSHSDSKLLSDSRGLPFQGYIQNEHWLSENNLPSLKSLRIPVYGIFGKNDGLFNEKQFLDLTAFIGKENILIVEHASHNIFIDQQAIFLKFLQEKMK